MPLPPLNEKHAIKITSQYYGLIAKAKLLPGDIDRNFLLTTENGKFVLKIHSLETLHSEIDFQNTALQHLRGFEGVPHVIPNKDREPVFLYEEKYLVRMVSYLEGTLFADMPSHSPNLLRQLGAFLAQLDLALEDFTHPAMRRKGFLWDLSRAEDVIVPRLATLPHKEMVEKILSRFRQRIIPVLPDLRWQVIHNDANDYNILLKDGMVSGILDFGDMLCAPRVNEVAIAAAYALLGEKNPLEAAAQVVAGYHSINPLTVTEISLLYDLISTRLAVSVSVSSERAMPPSQGKGWDWGNDYHQISAKPAWDALEKLTAIPPEDATQILGSMCPPRRSLQAGASLNHGRLSSQAILKKRKTHLNPSLSISYKNPLHIVRGMGEFLYDSEGKAYLDCVNNVCHVGHSHPRVVAALSEQAAILNTNTRYLHENIVRLAERITATMPAPLSVCFFTNSGSEANDLALRLARTYTGQRDMLVLEGAYHGNLSSLVEISPYKFDSVGGAGAPSWVHKLAMPCKYRGIYRDAPDAVARYMVEAQREIASAQGLAAYISEAMIGTGGQIAFPKGYLAEIYKRVRAAGGVCIADEVQHGFGRFGAHFWGFQSHGVVPDIVVMGKPMGNGHPLAGVVTTPQIAAAFNNGMEYFNTFGGNPVSCAVGLAVLDVIEDEHLQENAHRVGAKLKAGLLDLQARYPLIGDVRGEGLFLGIELVRDRASLEPATAEAYRIEEELLARQILVSVDGIHHNVIKLKPPMVFNEADAERLIRELETILVKF